MEFLPHILIIPVFCHPYTDRHNESQLLAEGNLLRQYFCRGCPECHFILFLIDFIPGRYPGCDIKDSCIRQGHSDLQTCRGTHLIHIQVNIAFQPDLDVYIGHLGERVKAFCFLVDSLCQFDRQNIRIIPFQDLLLFILFHDVCIADIECFQILSITFCIAVHVISAEELVRAFP